MKLQGIFGLLLAILLYSCTGVANPLAREGKMDLSHWSWEQGNVELSGEWQFGRDLRTVPDHWVGDDAGGPSGQGYGIYRLKLQVPPSDTPLGIRYGTFSTAMVLRANGAVLAQEGRPSKSPKDSIPAYKPGVSSLPSGESILLEVEVSNHEYRTGGMWVPMVIGPLSTLEYDRWKEESWAVGMASFLGALGLLALLLFFTARGGAGFLYSGLFALLSALRALVTGEYVLVQMFPTLSFDLLIRLEYVSALVPFPVALMFYQSFFSGLIKPWLLRGLLVAMGVFCLFIPTTPLFFLTNSILWFYPLATGVVVIIFVQALKRVMGEKDHYFLFAGSLFIAIAGVLDMAFSAFFARTGTFLPWGMGCLVVVQSFALGKNLLQSHEKTRVLLQEKDLLIKEIHHRVKNSLQVVSSLMSLQGNRIESPQYKEIFTTMRRRIIAIAQVHEKLYGQGVGGSPELGTYIRDLLNLQNPRDGLSPGKVEFHSVEKPILVGVDFCVDVGLIITELVTNAQKHGNSLGAPPGEKGEIVVDLTVEENRLVIKVQDCGPGYPAGFTLGTAASGLGFRIIQAILTRNDGRLEFLPGPGAAVLVNLRLPFSRG